MDPQSICQFVRSVKQEETPVVIGNSNNWSNCLVIKKRLPFRRDASNKALIKQSLIKESELQCNQLGGSKREWGTCMGRPEVLTAN